MDAQKNPTSKDRIFASYSAGNQKMSTIYLGGCRYTPHSFFHFVKSEIINPPNFCQTDLNFKQNRGGGKDRPFPFPFDVQHRKLSVCCVTAVV